jgi:hypothetical protein
MEDTIKMTDAEMEEMHKKLFVVLGLHKGKDDEKYRITVTLSAKNHERLEILAVFNNHAPGKMARLMIESAIRNSAERWTPENVREMLDHVKIE